MQKSNVLTIDKSISEGIVGSPRRFAAIYTRDHLIFITFSQFNRLYLASLFIGFMALFINSFKEGFDSFRHEKICFLEFQFIFERSALFLFMQFALYLVKAFALYLYM